MSTDADRLKMLVPVDFSEASRTALAWAFDYALRAPCEVHVVHVAEPREDIPNQMWAIDKETAVELERMVPDAEDRSQVGPILRHVATGRPATEILALAEKIGAELIVMGTNGRTGLSRLVIGSVAEKVVRHAECPVVCVKPGRA